MRLLNAIVRGLKPGREVFLPMLLFWLVGLVPAWLGTGPMRSGLHAVLDNSPVAAEISSGGGLDLLGELGMHQPGLWAAGFAFFIPALLLSLVLSLFVASGTYARAASPEGSVWTRFWTQGARFFVPAAVVVLLNGILWGVVALLPGAVLGGIGMANKGTTDPGLSWTLFRTGIVCLLILVAFFEGGAGFGRAWCARAGKGANPARAFLKGLVFSLRHLPQTQSITWFYGALRLLAIAAPVVWLSPGFATEGAVVGSFVLTQMGFLVAAYLKSAEIRSQCEYLGELPAATEEVAAGTEPVPPVVETPSPEVLPPPQEDMAPSV